MISKGKHQIACSLLVQSPRAFSGSLVSRTLVIYLKAYSTQMEGLCIKNILWVNAFLSISLLPSQSVSSSPVRTTESILVHLYAQEIVGLTSACRSFNWRHLLDGIANCSSRWADLWKFKNRSSTKNSIVLHPYFTIQLHLVCVFALFSHPFLPPSTSSFMGLFDHVVSASLHLCPRGQVSYTDRPILPSVVRYPTSVSLCSACKHAPTGSWPWWRRLIRHPSSRADIIGHLLCLRGRAGKDGKGWWERVVCWEGWEAFKARVSKVN